MHMCESKSCSRDLFVIPAKFHRIQRILICCLYIVMELDTDLMMELGTFRLKQDCHLMKYSNDNSEDEESKPQ